MFIDDEWKQEDESIEKQLSNSKDQTALSSIDEARHHYSNLQIALFAGGVLILVTFIGLLFLLFAYSNDNNSPEPVTPTVPQTFVSTSSAGLPNWDELNGHGHGYSGSSTELLQAENMAFGTFYNFPSENQLYVASDYELPLNVKSDVSNYYDISRKLDMDTVVDDIGEYGFATLANQFDTTDIFATYQSILNKEIPSIITSDYLIYTFQNILKEAYKEIEKNAFFDSLWALDKKLYDVAQTRFKQRDFEMELSGDVLLEGMRMETAYLAVVLKLLEPVAEQIEMSENFLNPNKFSLQEADSYSLELPQTIEDQVNKEVSLVREASGIQKSPVLLYNMDYSRFKVPDDYALNAKLTNFYLAKRWLNSLFPLYYQSEECENCLLDYEDWMISAAAATLLSQDFSQDQDIKNQWATIYKVIAFFSGLRQDLTYLQYSEKLSEVFGQDFAAEKIFNLDKNRDERLGELQKILARVEFNTIEGSQDRNSQTVRPQLGLRALQEPYWPNDYLFDKLTGEDMTYNRSFSRAKDSMPPTLCVNANKIAYRCKGFGMDVINLLAPDLTDSPYFEANSDYINYDVRVNELRQEVISLDINAWNSNMYWLSLDLAQRIINTDRNNLPLYAQSQKWQSQREVGVALSGWVNVHLAPDTWAGFVEDKVGGLGDFLSCNKYSIVEPNLDLLNDLMAKTNMLSQALDFLDLGAQTNSATVELKDYYNKLDAIKKIVIKQINGKERNEEDCRTIKDFSTARSIERAGKKVFEICDDYRGLEESIEQIKLLLVVYRSVDGKNILAVGPIFDYFETAVR